VKEMRRTWVLVVDGVVLVGSATILGLVLFRRYGIFELTLPELTIWSVVVGVQMAVFLALLFAQMTAPSVKPRSAFFLFGLFGAVCGLIAGVVFGLVGIQEEVCGPEDFDALECGWSVFGVGFVELLPWPLFGLVVALGVILGTVGGVTAAWLRRGKHAPMTAMLDV
jgi:hypothetical protein